MARSVHPIPSGAKLAIGVKLRPIRLAQSLMIANLASPLASSSGSNATGHPQRLRPRYCLSGTVLSGTVAAARDCRRFDRRTPGRVGTRTARHNAGASGARLQTPQRSSLWLSPVGLGSGEETTHSAARNPRGSPKVIEKILRLRQQLACHRTATSRQNRPRSPLPPSRDRPAGHLTG